MLRCGLLGEKLGHSYSPEIHGMLADYSYRLFERRPEELEEFLSGGEWDGINVTIPYKKAVLPFCRELSPVAARVGSVNTIVRRSDGSLYGDNTDYFGFETMLRHSGISVVGEKVLVLGNGGVAPTVCDALQAHGARPVVISRRGENHYDNLSRHSDAAVIVNTTPVGMYPGNGEKAVDLEDFPVCRGVLDLVYNPARTALLLQAEERGIPCEGGLLMLVAQAKRSCELFSGSRLPEEDILRVWTALRTGMENIVLVGMPGCGKSTVAAELSRVTGRPVMEADRMVEELAGMDIPTIFRTKGEEEFRRLETSVLSRLGRLSGGILSTGGGCVTREENYPLLHQNGRILWLKRNVQDLPTVDRPISQATDLVELYESRRAAYDRFADFEVNNNGTVEDTVARILELI